MKKRQIFVELTPLLDVILIILFVILVNSGQSAAASAESAAAAQREAESLRWELAETKSELDAAVRREITLTVVEEESMVLSVSVEDTAVRRILVETEYGEKKNITLDSARYDTAAQRLHDTLRNCIFSSGRESAYITFHFDRNSILAREFELISGVLRDLKPELEKEGIYLAVIELDHQ